MRPSKYYPLLTLKSQPSSSKLIIVEQEIEIQDINHNTLEETYDLQRK